MKYEFQENNNITCVVTHEECDGAQHIFDMNDRDILIRHSVQSKIMYYDDIFLFLLAAYFLYNINTFSASEYFSEIEKFHGFQHKNNSRITLHHFLRFIAEYLTKQLILYKYVIFFIKFVTFHH